MGDFNINLLNLDRHIPSSEFLDMMYSNMFIVQFRKKLELVNWTNILSQSKCQNAFAMFHQEYCKLYEECFPLVKVN